MEALHLDVESRERIARNQFVRRAERAFDGRLKKLISCAEIAECAAGR